MPFGIQDIQGYIRLVLGSILLEGDTAVDATAGRGRDTLFLAQCVGREGRVYAFDIQPEALAETQRRLQEHAQHEQVVLSRLDHVHMGEVVEGRAKVVMFNLGYLPGGDHALTTQSESTLAAMKAALDLLEVNGIMAITAYRAHPGGEREAFEVDAFLAGLSRSAFSVLKGEYINQMSNAPYWILVQRKREDFGHEDSPPNKNSGTDR